METGDGIRIAEIEFVKIEIPLVDPEPEFIEEVPPTVAQIEGILGALAPLPDLHGHSDEGILAVRLDGAVVAVPAVGIVNIAAGSVHAEGDVGDVHGHVVGSVAVPASAFPAVLAGDLAGIEGRRVEGIGGDGTLGVDLQHDFLAARRSRLEVQHAVIDVGRHKRAVKVEVKGSVGRESPLRVLNSQPFRLVVHAGPISDLAFAEIIHGHFRGGVFGGYDKTVGLQDQPGVA